MIENDYPYYPFPFTYAVTFGGTMCLPLLTTEKWTPGISILNITIDVASNW